MSDEDYYEARKEYLSKVKEVVVSDDEEYLGRDYAYYIGAEKLTLGKQLRQISPNDARNFESLKEIDVNGNRFFKLKENCLFYARKKELAIGLGVPRIPDFIKKAYLKCFVERNPVERFYIGAGVESIDADRNFIIGAIELSPDNKAFKLADGCLVDREDNLVIGVESIIPKTVKSIGDHAFVRSDIKEIDIPDGVIEVGNYAFYECENLERVRIPASVLAIGSSAFQDCVALKEVIIEGDNLATIHSEAFEGCVSLTKIKLPDSVHHISGYAFANCTALSDFDFSYINCDFIWDGMLGNTAIKELKLPKNISSVSEQSFAQCKFLEVVDMPGVEEIWPDAFEDSDNIKTVKLKKRGVSAYGAKLKDVFGKDADIQKIY